MLDRDNKLEIIREKNIGEISKEISHEELFQNTTLRPILKFQNDILIHIFINYATKNKSVFFSLSNEDKINYIEKTTSTDYVFRNQLIGLIVGLFTIKEFCEYIKNSSNLNKRMINMLTERLKSQIHLLNN